MPHFEGLPPPSSHTFLAKSEGVNPPLCSYIIRNVWSTPPAPEPVGVGDTNTTSTTNTTNTTTTTNPSHIAEAFQSLLPDSPSYFWIDNGRVAFTRLLYNFFPALSPSFFLRFLSCLPTFRVPPLKLRLQMALEWLHECCMDYITGRKSEHETSWFSV